jgi:hypothetical protein
MLERNAGRFDALHSPTLPIIPMMPAVKIWMIMPEAVIWPRVIPVTKIKLRGVPVDNVRRRIMPVGIFTNLFHSLPY